MRSKTFCALPWIHLSTRPNGHVRICCAANASSVGPSENKDPEIGVVKTNSGEPANLANVSISESLNNDYMKNIRTKMLSGEIPESCTKCFREEESGFFSKRQWETEYWDKKIDLDSIIEKTKSDGSIDVDLKYIDLRLGNKCNLKCSMCSPHDSSAWIPDWKKMFPKVENENLKSKLNWASVQNGGKYNWHKNERFWTDLYEHIPSIKQLYFAGGEPLIIDEHYALLERCVELGYAKNIELRYNSNGLIIPDKLLDLWNEFEYVKFHFSVDSIGDMNKYIRYPAEWNLTVNNLQKLDNSADHIDVSIACAVQLMNIYYLPDFLQWNFDQNWKKINPNSQGWIEFHLVYLPDYLNVKILPKWMKSLIREKFEIFYQQLKLSNVNTDHKHGIPRLQTLLNFMDSEDWSSKMDEFKEYIRLLDETRQSDFARTFPEMQGLL